MITELAKEITNNLYIAYGSSSGWLFGLSPDHKEAVEAIIQSTLDELGERFTNRITPKKDGK